MKRIALLILFLCISVQLLYAQKTAKAKSLALRAHKEYLDERYSYAIAFTMHPSKMQNQIRLFYTDSLNRFIRSKNMILLMCIMTSFIRCIITMKK